MQITINMKAEAANKLVHIPYTGTKGLYAAIVPSPEDVERIMRIAEDLELSPDEHALHATVISSKVSPMVEADVVQSVLVENRLYEAMAIGVESWTGRNEKPYIVLKIVSVSLIQANAAFQRQGAEHTFLPFAPHITLSDSVPVDDAMKARIEYVNKKLALNPLPITMHNPIVGDFED